MRKIDPANVRRAFRSEMADLLATYARTANALSGTQRALADLSRLTSGTFLVSY
jgi:hypothetical protein